MRVTIDTKHDSLEEIKKVVALLSEMIHKQNSSNSSGSSMLDFNLPGMSSAEGSNVSGSSSGGMMNMFDTPSSNEAKPNEETTPAGSLTGVFSGFFDQNVGGQRLGQEKRETGEIREIAYGEGEAKMEVY